MSAVSEPRRNSNNFSHRPDVANTRMRVPYEDETKKQYRVSLAFYMCSSLYPFGSSGEQSAHVVECNGGQFARVRLDNTWVVGHIVLDAVHVLVRDRDDFSDTHLSIYDAVDSFKR